MLEFVTHDSEVIEINFIKENAIFGCVDNLFDTIFVAFKFQLEVFSIKWKLSKVLAVLNNKHCDSYNKCIL